MNTITNKRHNVLRRHAARSMAIAITVTALTAAASPAHAQAFAGATASRAQYTQTPHSPAAACASLAAFKSRDLVSIAATPVASAANTPAYCRVEGVIAPEVAFEVSLPERWNGRFYMIGNGGHAGDALDNPGRVAQRDEALALGFAFAQTNTGHDSRKEPGASFVLSDPRKAIDYAYRAVHVTAATGKDLVREYYERPASHAYWNSCSNGGRQGLLEAQRYPEDFDGIYANAPWVDQTGFTMGAIWNQQAISAAPLTAGKLSTLAQQVMAQCDAIDGLKDGLIDDPRRCNFDARTMVPSCPAGSDADNCLTPAQADAVMKVYGGPVSKGKPLFPGYMPGSEQVSGGAGNNAPASAWLNMIVPAQPGAKPADYNLAEGTIRFLAHTSPQPDYDPVTAFNFDRDVRKLDAWAAKANAKSTNLNALRRRGGKVLMSYGWSDQILQPLAGVSYYEALQRRYGARTGEFVRLFMVPGMAHCSGGIGTDRFDPMTALIDWVEKGVAPDSLAASRVVNGQTVRTRPLCPYPQVARYSGSGSIDEAANFRCVSP
ncbi:MAG: tannase/feruloyl esterase family alpha/beta hydrolase [Nevskiaceae bacterium]|jgi:feruloyl esterase|nr:tannase/feruloyl esterase family alpha/beta hydrolase [Nevskiaceae bacterium]